MHTDRNSIGLRDLGVLRMRGPDAGRFLQGQLSSDVSRLSASRSQLAGYHNPQGRTVAVLRLAQLAPDDIVAVLPRELAPAVASRLSKFILRSKVKIVDESGSWQVAGIIGAEPAGVELPPARDAQSLIARTVFVRVEEGPARSMAISPADDPFPGVDFQSGDPESWRRLDVAAGLPQVYAPTSEEFVAQMLNLDVLDAIAFDKGCYTGQEVIARAHYRGRVKRRMQRFVSRTPCHLAPGDTGQLDDGRTFKVVLAAKLPDGRCDFLAVAPLIHDGAGGATAAGDGPANKPIEAAPPARLAADPAPLPYALPD